MLHATCYSCTFYWWGNNTHYGWTTCTHSQRQQAEGEYVYNTAGPTFPNVFIVRFAKKRYICSANTETLQEPKSEVTENERHNKNTSEVHWGG